MSESSPEDMEMAHSQILNQLGNKSCPNSLIKVRKCKEQKFQPQILRAKIMYHQKLNRKSLRYSLKGFPILCSTK
ncbi:hypothetical protein FGO68_gene8341 [Halteria grandinella]|uniref:Uncharacterized protein n=1 Tax=Halteria grandinella TaxID=5974 RepID=A0A8J8NVQ2_HALGN|nr:hypothetical protein FGO68_gene8341 [Halteria grandinella]